MLRLLDGTKAMKKTEVHVVHISLDNLYRLAANLGMSASPFKGVHLHKTHCPIAQVILEDHVLLLTHRARSLLFVNLLTKQSCRIKLRNAISEYARVPGPTGELLAPLTLITGNNNDIRFKGRAPSRI